MKFVCVAAIAFVVAGCATTHAVKVRQPQCRAVRGVLPPSPETVAYLATLVQKESPIFQHALDEAAGRLKRQHFSMELEQSPLTAEFVVRLDRSGSVLEWKPLCIFGIKEIDDAMTIASRSIEEVDRPPVSSLDIKAQMMQTVRVLLR